jgi:hypothetical protein
MTPTEQSIITLTDIPSDFVSQLPQIDASELTILWHYAYYDGPQSGVMRYQGKPCWFEIRDNADVFHRYTDDKNQEWIVWHQRFLLAEIISSQFDELHWHNELFRRLVGTHWDYNESGKRVKGEVMPDASQKKYYRMAEHWKPIDLSQNRVIGWFEWVSHAEADLSI